MLDKWFKFISGRLDAHTAAAIAQRAEIERERAGDEARQHAGREFLNAEGFTTPLPKAYERAQNVYARSRREFEKSGGDKALALLVAMLVARDKRDDAAAALKRYEEAEAERQDTGMHRDVKPYYADAFKHGLEPRHLADVPQETRAITYDLIRWGGHDPKMQDPDNPLRQVLAIYASRLIVRPERFGDTSRSVAGVPVAPQRRGDPVYYMFNEQAGRSVVTSSEAPQLEASKAGPVPDTAGETMSADPSSTELDIIAPVHSEEPGAATEATGLEDDAGMDFAGEIAAPIATDEYALPGRFSADEKQRIYQAARQFVASDPDWEYELQAAARWFHGSLSTAQIIERVEATPTPRGSTPFRYFVEAVRAGDLTAGREAYQIATIKRVMFEIATAPEYEQARRNLGLD